jgi:NAD dependent epimerase/dehydratase family enzyme
LGEGQRVLPRRAQAAGFEWGFEHLEPTLRDLLAT